jgi:hypothetical protein
MHGVMNSSNGLSRQSFFLTRFGISRAARQTNRVKTRKYLILEALRCRYAVWWATDQTISY